MRKSNSSGLMCSRSLNPLDHSFVEEGKKVNNNWVCQIMPSRSKVLSITKITNTSYHILDSTQYNYSYFLASQLQFSWQNRICAAHNSPTNTSSTFSLISIFPCFYSLVLGSSMLQQYVHQSLGSVYATSVSHVCERSCSVNASTSKQLITSD